jgi:hypothetical protein
MRMFPRDRQGSSSSTFKASLRGALSGREPPPLAFIERSPALSLACCRCGVHRRVHGPARCQHHTAFATDARGRVQRQPRCRHLGCGRICSNSGCYPHDSAACASGARGRAGQATQILPRAKKAEPSAQKPTRRDLRRRLSGFSIWLLLSAVGVVRAFVDQWFGRIEIGCQIKTIGFGHLMAEKLSACRG